MILEDILLCFVKDSFGLVAFLFDAEDVVSELDLALELDVEIGLEMDSVRLWRVCED